MSRNKERRSRVGGLGSVRALRALGSRVQGPGSRFGRYRKSRSLGSGVWGLGPGICVGSVWGRGCGQPGEDACGGVAGCKASAVTAACIRIKQHA
eukprot:2392817-Rhodomonas_salina.2